MESKYDKETKTIWYSEDFVIKTLIEFFEDSDIDGRGISFSFYDSDKEDLLRKFMTTKGFRKSLKKAGLIGTKFAKEIKEEWKYLK